jgi:hypothetical protein
MTDQSNAAGQPPSRRGRTVWLALRWFLRWWIIVPLLLLAIYLVALNRTEKQLAAELAKVEASGGALRLADLAPRVPLGEANAAEVYLRAFDLVTVDWEALERMGEDPDLARQVLATQDPALRLLEQASQIRACAFPVDWDAWPAIAFPHFAPMREGGRLLAARAEVQAADGQMDAALSSCASILRMAEHTQREPILIGALVGFALNGIGVTALEESLSQGDPSPAACRALFEQLAAMDPHAALERAFQGERATHVEIFELIHAGEIRDLFAAFSGGEPVRWVQPLLLDLYRTLGRPLLNLDEVSSLRAMEQNIAALGLPPGEGQQQMEAVVEQIHQLPVYRSVLTKMIMPVFTRATWSRDRVAADIGAAQIALALTAYHAEHRRYPETLADLAAAGWDIPDDPFTGQPYIYRLEGDGFIVYSVGPDLTDDGGLLPLWKETAELTQAEEERRRDRYDLIFRRPR